MASSSDKATPSVSSSNPDHGAALRQIFTLLKNKDDTSRFVGLSIMRSLLETHEELQKDPSVVMGCWDAIPVKFLQRLLSSKPSGSRSPDEAQVLVSLGISIIRVFSMLLPAESLAGEKFAKLCGDLLKYSQDGSSASPQTQKEALDALIAVSSRDDGAYLILEQQKDVLDTIVQQAPHNTSALQLVTALMLTRRPTPTEVLSKKQMRVFEGLVDLFHQCKFTDANAVIERLQAIAEILDIVKPDQLARSCIQRLGQFVRSCFMAYPSSATCKAGTRVLEKIIGCLDLPEPFFPKASEGTSTLKPFSYTFIALVVIDIRSTIPSLLEKIASDEYTEISLQLAASYDVLAYFVFCLINLQETEVDDPEMTNNQRICDIPPDLLLQLRKDIAETVSLTIEYFRDRWDAAVAGVRGLDLSSRASTQSSSEPPAITWDNPNIPLAQDPIIVAGTRMLGIWLREDENDKLRQEASGIMDVLLGLYKERPEERSAVLMALEGIVRVDEGIKSLLENNGFDLLHSELLKNIGGLGSDGNDDRSVASLVRVLLPVLESANVSQTKQNWTKLLPIMAGKAETIVRGPPGVIDSFIAAGQLAVVMMLKASTRDQTSKVEACGKLLDIFTVIQQQATDSSLSEGAQEVSEGLAQAIRGSR